MAVAIYVLPSIELDNLKNKLCATSSGVSLHLQYILIQRLVPLEKSAFYFSVGCIESSSKVHMHMSTILRHSFKHANLLKVECASLLKGTDETLQEDVISKQVFTFRGLFTAS